MKKIILMAMIISCIAVTGCKKEEPFTPNIDPDSLYQEDTYNEDDIFAENEENSFEEDVQDDDENDIQMENESEETEDVQDEDTQVGTEVSAGEVIFTTEYDIEDYCHGRYIVSKNDGLLYGVLDQNGNEIIPVKYDSISFLNKEDIERDSSVELYIGLGYEDENSVADSEGNIILTTPDRIEVYSCQLGNPYDSDKRFVVYDSFENEKINFYDEKGDLIGRLNFPKAKKSGYEIIDQEWISKNNYIISFLGAEDNNRVTRLYDKNDKVLKEWRESPLLNIERINNKIFFITSTFKDEWKPLLYSIDESGNLIEENANDENENYEIVKGNYGSYTINKKENYPFKPDSEEVVHLGKNDDITLYRSNDTWKLVDSEGEPLYDERYYEGYKGAGAYFLENENKEICVINKNADLVIDYGWLTIEGKEIYFMGNRLTTDDFFNGDDGMVIITSGEMGNDVHFFSNK